MWQTISNPRLGCLSAPVDEVEELERFAELADRPAAQPSEAVAAVIRAAETELQAGRHGEVVALALRAEAAAESPADQAFAWYYLARGRSGQDEMPAAVRSAVQALAADSPLGPVRVVELLRIVRTSPDRALAADAAARSVAVERRKLGRLPAGSGAMRSVELARALIDLSVARGASGDLAGALSSSSESLEIYRRLAAADNARFVPGLALSLNNYSIRLGEVGRREEGLVAVEEAVTVYRRLAEVYPDAYLPDFAMSLNNLSVRLADVGRPAESLVAAGEAVTIRRRLADAYPDLYLRDLAQSLQNLCERLTEVGRVNEAAAIASEARTVGERAAARVLD
jgi:tetratricopeptide (TPR) repeat protein